MSWSNLICRKSWVITELPGTLKESLKVKVVQSCPTLCDPMDCVHGIHQAKILEWAAFPFSRGSFPTQGLNPGLPHCRRILYQLTHKGRKSLKSKWNINKTFGIWLPPSDPGWVAIKGVLDGIWDIRGWVKLSQKLWALGNRSTVSQISYLEPSFSLFRSVVSMAETWTQLSCPKPTRSLWSLETYLSYQQPGLHSRTHDSLYTQG